MSCARGGHVGRRRRTRVKRGGHRSDPHGVLAIYPVARRELVDRRDADVAAHLAAQEVVEHAQAKRAANRVDAVHVELCHRGRHDREAARKHRRAFGLERGKPETIDVAAADHPLAQPRETVRRNAGGREAVLLEDFGQRERGPRRCERRLPAFAVKSVGNRLNLGARGRIRLGERSRRETAVGKEALCHPDAAQFHRLEALGLEGAADDEFGGAAADVDHEARVGRRRQHMRDAVVDEARLLVTGDDVDREPEGALGARHERRRVRRDAERVGCDGAHRRRMQSPQPLGEAREARERGALRIDGEPAALVDACADAQRLAPRVKAEDLVALDAPDLEAEAVPPMSTTDRVPGLWAERAMVAERSRNDTTFEARPRGAVLAFSVTLARRCSRVRHAC